MQRVTLKGGGMLHFLYLQEEVLLCRLCDVVCRLLFVCLLAQVSVSDIRSMKIPDRLNGAILVLGAVRRGILFAFGAQAPGAAGGMLLADGLYGMLAAALPMYLLALAGPGSLGGGDIKLAAACGVFLGAGGVLWGTAAGMVMAGVYAAAALLRHKKARSVFPLGPFLSCGYLLQMMCSS